MSSAEASFPGQSGTENGRRQADEEKPASLVRFCGGSAGVFFPVSTNTLPVLNLLFNLKRSLFKFRETECSLSPIAALSLNGCDC